MTHDTCCDKLGFVSSGSAPFALERIGGYYLRIDRRFDLITNRLFPCYITARSIPRLIRRALRRRL